MSITPRSDRAPRSETRRWCGIACPPLFLLLSIGVWACCGVQHRRTQSETGQPLLHSAVEGLTIAQIEQLPSFTARVVDIHIREVPKGLKGAEGKLHFSVALLREDGLKTGIGEFDPKAADLRLVQALEVGRDYVFPDVLLKLEEAAGKAAERGKSEIEQ